MTKREPIATEMSRPDTLCDDVCATREVLHECVELSHGLGMTLFGLDTADSALEKAPACVREDIALLYELAHDVRDTLLSMKKALGG